MKILKVPDSEMKKWNSFVRTNYPPVGSFMQTWEWGEFQKDLGRSVERYFIEENSKILGAFTIIRHSLPFKFKYGYLPRGPVFDKRLEASKIAEILHHIKSWAHSDLSDLMFLRLEPPFGSHIFDSNKEGFRTPPYYVQPRYNLTVPLDGSEEEIISRFHSSTRSNLGRAEKRGVTVRMKDKIADEEYAHFSGMMKETIDRTGKNVYPDRAYFSTFIKSIPHLSSDSDPEVLRLGVFYGYHNGEPAAANFVLFFGDTATYLYGASSSRHLNSKVTTYLHWTAMKEAKRRGYKYYDLGGIDETKWPGLTSFKRQFRGTEFNYIGNIDIPIKAPFYAAYGLLRKIKK